MLDNVYVTHKDYVTDPGGGMTPGPVVRQPLPRAGLAGAAKVGVFHASNLFIGAAVRLSQAGTDRCGIREAQWTN